ncbi:effector-binding domain-containing protein [Rhodococcus sp. AG1013]|uniref:GyrI-like domain-containing protein n=1 Tax=Rhodococcus sp. AG1013 TaxID=2183996 RepID=UPI000E0A8437|nr:GyrI-like domain-containing protein [Rhodococcus sp. AG1013]RDI17991.1 effector-binding domain-containing protein [Rhodococcus sp. AG1013]
MSYDIRIRDIDEQPTGVVDGNVDVDSIAAFLGPAFAEVARAAAAQDIVIVGPPFGRFRPRSDGIWNVEAGFPMARTIEPTGRVESASLPAGRCASTVHVGSYDTVESAYIALTQWIAEHGYATTGEPWECYLDDPDVPLPRTEIIMPIVWPVASGN